MQQEKENDIHTVVKLLTQKRMYNIDNNLLSERTKTQTEQTRESVYQQLYSQRQPRLSRSAPESVSAAKQARFL